MVFGLPQPPSDQARFDEAELELLRAVGLGEQMLGSDATLQLTQVMFVTADPAAACKVALELCRFVEGHPTTLRLLDA